MGDVVKRDDGEEKFLELFRNLSPEKKLPFVTEALKESERQREVVIKKLDENKDKLATIERVMAKQNWYSMREASDILAYKGVGQNNLFQYLGDEGILQRSNGSWIPYREYIERGYFKVNVYEFQVDTGRGLMTKIQKKTEVSLKGLDFIRKRLADNELDNPVEE